MIKASGRIRVILIVICVVIVIASIWVVGSRQQNGFQFLSKSGVSNPDYQNNVITHRLKGHVKSVKEVNYRQQVSLAELTDSVAHRSLTFDDRGNVIRDVTFDQNDQLIKDRSYTYDDANNYASQTTYGAKGEVVLQYFYTFDDLGRLLKITPDPKNSDLGWEFVYRDTVDGYIQQPGMSIFSDGSHRPMKKTFDTVKHELRIEMIYKDTTKQRIYVHFNKRGNVIERTVYRPLNIPVSRYAAAYNSNNLPVREEYSIDKSIEYYYAYDNQGNVIEYTCITDGNVDQKSYRAVYTYDNTGNWTHRDLLRLDGTPKTSVDRVIEYY